MTKFRNITEPRRRRKLTSKGTPNMRWIKIGDRTLHVTKGWKPIDEGKK